MAITLQDLRNQIAVETVALEAAKAQRQELEEQMAELRQQGDVAGRDIESRELTIANLKNELYAFFQATLDANPGAATYAAMGQKMDEVAAQPPPEPEP